MQDSREPYFWELVLIQGSGLDGCALFPLPAELRSSSFWKPLLFSPIFRLGRQTESQKSRVAHTQARRPRAQGLARKIITAGNRLPRSLELSHLLVSVCFLLLPLQTGFLRLQLPQLFVSVSQLLLQLSSCNAVPESKKHDSNVTLHGKARGSSPSQRVFPFPRGLAQGREEGSDAQHNLGWKMSLCDAAELGMGRKGPSPFPQRAPLFPTASIPGKGPQTHLSVPKLG